MPDAGTSIVLTRESEGNRRWAIELEKAGYSVFQAPMIQTEPLPLTQAARHMLRRLPEFDWLVLTSSRSVLALNSLLHTANMTNLPMPPVAAVGERTAEAVALAGWKVKFVPLQANANALAVGLEPVREKNILIASTTISTSGLSQALTARGANVIEMPVYSTTPIRTSAPQLERLVNTGRVSFLVFASPSAITGLILSLAPDTLKRAHNLTVAAVGPTTAQAATAMGFRDVITAPRPTISGLILAMSAETS